MVEALSSPPCPPPAPPCVAAVMAPSATAGDDDRDRISIPIYNQRALSRPVYKTGGNPLGAKRGRRFGRSFVR